VTRRRSSPRSFHLALDAAREGWAPETLLAEIQQVWPVVVGEAVAAEASPSGERGGVVTVSCSASVWAQELDLMGPAIVERLNARMARGSVSRLRCITLPPGP